MASVLLVVFIASLFFLDGDMGKAKNKPKFTAIFSTSPDVNALSAARFFLFGARDIWFVVALPVYLGSVFAWDHNEVGGFLAIWVILYGFVQSIAPYITGKAKGRLPNAMTALTWVVILTAVTGILAYAMQWKWHIEWILIIGLFIFGAVFAVNSSMHSYLIVKYASHDGASMDVGFYYMSNAGGRLIGTLLSGLLFQWAGLIACLWASFAFLFISSVISACIVKRHSKIDSFSK
jgi:predicted MFS family arabinose efflux permease